MTPPLTRDHGGGLDAAIARFGGTRADWIDLSTGINPNPYPVGDLGGDVWTALPDRAAQDALVDAARRFWNVPDNLDVLAAPGASCLIAQMPRLLPTGTARIDLPTYNEHTAAFAGHRWTFAGGDADVRVVVHPNNPTGEFWDGSGAHRLVIVDESFCDVVPEQTLVSQAGKGVVILKSFGKFWGLAGLRLGFLIGEEAQVQKVRDWLGPWPVSGPALKIGAAALADIGWAERTRRALSLASDELDRRVLAAGGRVVGGTTLFRLYEVADAATWQDRLAQNHIWSRIFPYSKTWLRLGLPPESGWERLGAAL